MDIAVYIAVSALLVATGLMGGALWAERGQRREAQRAIAETLELLASERERAAADVKTLLEGLNRSHNDLVTGLKEQREKLEALVTRVSMISTGRQSPTHGTIQRPPTKAPG